MEREIVEQILKEEELKSAFLTVFRDTADLLNEHNLEEEDVDGYLHVYDLAIRSNQIKYKGKDLVYVELLTLNVYQHAKFYWRGRPHADKLVKLLDGKVSFRKGEKAHFYFELGSYYRSISRFQKALECFKKSYSLKKDENSLYYIVLTERFLYPDKDIEIEEKLLSQRIKLALQGKSGLKIDPIEKTEEFQNAYDEVHEEALDVIEKEGDLHLCFQMWDALMDLYAKRGIFWRSPALMNPNVRFD